MIYQINKEVAEQLKEFFDTFNFIDKVVVFGSRARHDCNPKSDIDLCIYSLEMSAEEFTKLKFEIDELPILYKLDIVHFEKSNKELKDNIIRDEKLLFQKVLNFDDFFENLAGKKYQVSKKDYLSEGLYPIVDQGQKFIIAYSNNEDKLFSINKPIIIFGDHTRAIKYIDFNFIIGADGTKVLITKNEKIDSKYAYYHLINTRIENLGYSRHFKILKEKTFILKTLTKQKEIASILDKAQALISLRKESIKKLEELSKSIFIDMFGDPVSNSKKWNEEKLKDITFKIGSGSTPRGGKDSYKKEGMSLIRSLNIHDNEFKYKNLALIDDIQAKSLSNVKVEENDILLNITGASVCRTSIVPLDVLPARVNQHVSIIRPKELINSKFLLHFFISDYKKKLMNIATSGGATREALTKENLELLDILVPPLELQKKFAKIIEKIEEQKNLYEEELEKLEENFKALLQKSFN